MEEKEIKTNQGFKVDKEGRIEVSGNGIIIKKLDDLIKKQDRTNQILSFIEKKIENLK